MWKRALSLRKNPSPAVSIRRRSVTSGPTSPQSDPESVPLPHVADPETVPLPELPHANPETLDPYPTEDDITRGFPLIFTVPGEYLSPWERRELNELEYFTSDAESSEEEEMMPDSDGDGDGDYFDEVTDEDERYWEDAYLEHLRIEAEEHSSSGSDDDIDNRG